MTDIYIDGSFKGSVVGYGVRIELGNGHEKWGGFNVNPASDQCLHEYFAFVEAATLARQLGLSPNQCHFISDCDAFAYGTQQSLATGHGSNGKRDTLLTQLCRVRKYYDTRQFNDALVYLTARFSWQKGHLHCVGNRRADYLATVGRSKMKDEAVALKHFMSYDRWLRAPYTGYNKEGKQMQHFVPFTASLLEHDGQVYALCV